MTKQEVLEIFFQRQSWLMPDDVCGQLRGFHQRSSVYSYLFRLHKQGLLSRGNVHGRIVYRISGRGIERLKFFRAHAENALLYDNGFRPSHGENGGIQAEHSR